MNVSARLPTSGRNGGTTVAPSAWYQTACRWAASPGADRRTRARRASCRSSDRTTGSPASAPRCARRPRCCGSHGSPGWRARERCCRTASSPRRCRPRAEGTYADSRLASAPPARCPRRAPRALLKDPEPPGSRAREILGRLDRGVHVGHKALTTSPSRTTTRRAVGRLTSTRPASANTLGVPT